MCAFKVDVWLDVPENSTTLNFLFGALTTLLAVIPVLYICKRQQNPKQESQQNNDGNLSQWKLLVSSLETLQIEIRSLRSELNTLKCTIEKQHTPNSTNHASRGCTTQLERLTRVNKKRTNGYVSHEEDQPQVVEENMYVQDFVSMKKPHFDNLMLELQQFHLSKKKLKPVNKIKRTM